jgi:hypothetical protein
MAQVEIGRVVRGRRQKGVLEPGVLVSTASRRKGGPGEHDKKQKRLRSRVHPQT